ncbi:MAG: tetratricopeptide repeat protein, partial [Nodosilinea sp.]
MSPPEPLPEPTTPSDSPPLGPTEAGQASAAAALQPAPPRVDQRVAGDGNQVIGDMQGGTAIGNVETLILNPPAPPIAPPLETYFGVPYQRNRFFTGRVEILNRLQQQLHQDGAVAINQIQAIRGLGGMGKTQTAVEYAYRSYESAPRPYDWVLWVRADTEANLISDFAGLATQLRLPAAHLKPEEQIPAVQQWLATRDRWLLIFDNADTPEWLQPFLSGRYQGCVLLTSRADVFDQVGIANPLSLDVLTDQEAVDFLFQRVGRDRTAPEEQAAIELATELGNLPLALEQAGAFIVRQRLSFQTYLSTYRKRRLQQLEKVKPQTGKYPASVLTTWSLNFQAVETANAASAEVLRLSAVVAPDAIPYRLLLQGAAHLGDQLALSLQAEEEAEAVMAVSELLTPLSQYSLIQWEPEQAQYSMHRMVQAVVQDGLTQDTQQLWVTRAVNALAATFPAVEFQTWAVCAQLLPHALKVMEQANAQGDGSEAFARLLNQTASYLQDQGRYDAAEPLYRDALQLYRELLGDSPAETLRERQLDVATSLNNLAYLYDSQGRYDDAEPLYHQALDLRRELLGERHPAVATSLNNLAGLYDSQGRY